MQALCELQPNLKTNRAFKAADMKILISTQESLRFVYEATLPVDDLTGQKHIICSVIFVYGFESDSVSDYSPLLSVFLKWRVK